jgi:hypothetical protein
MNKYSPHEAFGTHLGLAGGGTPSVYRGDDLFYGLEREIWLWDVMDIVTNSFHRWPTPKVIGF